MMPGIAVVKMLAINQFLAAAFLYPTDFKKWLCENYEQRRKVEKISKNLHKILGNEKNKLMYKFALLGYPVNFDAKIEEETVRFKGKVFGLIDSHPAFLYRQLQANSRLLNFINDNILQLYGLATSWNGFYAMKCSSTVPDINCDIQDAIAEVKLINEMKVFFRVNKDKLPAIFKFLWNAYKDEIKTREIVCGFEMLTNFFSNAEKSPIDDWIEYPMAARVIERLKDVLIKERWILNNLKGLYHSLDTLPDNPEVANYRKILTPYLAKPDDLSEDDVLTDDQLGGEDIIIDTMQLINSEDECSQPGYSDDDVPSRKENKKTSNNYQALACNANTLFSSKRKPENSEGEKSNKQPRFITDESKQPSENTGVPADDKPDRLLMK